MSIYFINTSLIGVLWSWYAAEEQNSSFFHRQRNIILFIIPIAIYSILTLMSYWTHWIFYIDRHGEYHRGSLFLLQYLVPYSYVLLTSIKALRRAFDKNNFLHRKKYIILAVFMLSPMSGSIIQMFFQDIPLLAMTTTFMALLLYIQQQNEKISVDPLTQINNRFQIMQHLTNKVLDYNGKKDLYLFMIDVDLFKIINDTYGHVEGDVALVLVAKALKKVGNDDGFFVGRYGGDEFMIIAELKAGESPKQIYDRIQYEIEQTNHREKKKYKLSLSVGFTKYTKSYCDIIAFIAAADKELYKIKKVRKKNMRVI